LNTHLKVYLFKYTKIEINKFAINNKKSSNNAQSTGGANKRGDQRWPPNDVRQQSELDNEARRQIALGPAFRPKRVNKVVRTFF
jgi:hypothetical protein